jgi:RNA polymerase sigma factor (TIGR02999 family)
MHEITQLLLAWSHGDQTALAQLAPLVQAELYRLAQHYLQRERAGVSLQASDLVQEAYVRLIDWQAVAWQNRAHFFGMAAHMMRRILVEQARRRQQRKHGGAGIRVSLTIAESRASEPELDVVSLHDALEDLAQFDPRKSRIVELRFFGGLSESEIAEVLQLSARTVRREWQLARVWLYRELKQEEPDEA